MAVVVVRLSMDDWSQLSPMAAQTWSQLLLPFSLPQLPLEPGAQALVA